MRHKALLGTLIVAILAISAPGLPSYPLTLLTQTVRVGLALCIQ